MFNKRIKNTNSFLFLMRIIFVEAKSRQDLLMPKSVLNKIRDLGKNIGLVTTVQHAHKIRELKEQLESIGKNVFLAKGSLTKHKAQILGCDVTAAISIKDKVDFFIYVGSGRFHPIEVAFRTKKKVFVYNPYSKKLGAIDEKDIKKYEARIRAGRIAFLEAENIGLLVSQKPGQKKLGLVLELKEKIKRKGKNAFILLFDTLDFSQLENFPFIDCFINTACPRMIDDYDKFPRPVVNYEFITEFLNS